MDSLNADIIKETQIPLTSPYSAKKPKLDLNLSLQPESRKLVPVYAPPT